MHVLFVHPNYPAQFGPVARRLARTPGWRVTFCTQGPAGSNVGGREAIGPDGIERVYYRPESGATKATHYCSRTFENAVWATHAVHGALKRRSDIRPDVIVGHSGFGTTLFLPELYPGVPVVNLLEYYYRPHHAESDMEFRRDLGWKTPEENFMRARCRNAMILLDLEQASAAYTPTEFQRSCFPERYRDKLEVIFDGVDRSVYHGHGEALRPAVGARGPREVAGRMLPAGARIVTYVARGFESMRGFDVFLRAARRIAAEIPDVWFIVVGSDKQAYGGDETHIAPHASFREWAIAREGAGLDLSRFVFTGRVPEAELARLLAMTDVHIYLTVPFVLSWSMMDAMSCGAVVVGSDTPPVREMIRDGENGLLADFFSPEEIAAKAMRVLRDPAGHRELGRAAERMIVERYSVEVVLPGMVALYERAVGGGEGTKGQRDKGTKGERH